MNFSKTVLLFFWKTLITLNLVQKTGVGSTNIAGRPLTLL